MNWIDVKKELPKIPRGEPGIILDIWVIFNRIGKGSRVADAIYEYRNSNQAEFFGNGTDISEFTVTHWMVVERPNSKKSNY